MCNVYPALDIKVNISPDEVALLLGLGELFSMH